MENLPVSHFEWCNPTIEEVLARDYSCNNGMFVKCDHEYPEELHELHNDLPLAPERIMLGYVDASPTSHASFTSKIQAKKYEIVCGHLRPRKKYVVHARVLQFYDSHRIELNKIHRAIKCLQSTFLLPWIDIHSAKRALASYDFEKDLYKLLNNAVFGRTMQNQCSQKDVRIAICDEQMMKFSAKSSFNKFFEVDDDSKNIFWTFNKEKVKLNKPIFMGAAILDFSKMLMFRFYYDDVKLKYGDKAKLFFTDTNSLCYSIEC